MDKEQAIEDKKNIRTKSGKSETELKPMTLMRKVAKLREKAAK